MDHILKKDNKFTLFIEEPFKMDQNSIPTRIGMTRSNSLWDKDKLSRAGMKDLLV
jgi:hypothetical protein